MTHEETNIRLLINLVTNGDKKNKKILHTTRQEAIFSILFELSILTLFCFQHQLVVDTYLLQGYNQAFTSIRMMIFFQKND